MDRRIKFLSMLVVFAATIILSGLQTPALAQATTVTSNATFPFTETVATCDLTNVTISGKMHVLFHVTTDANGGRHVNLQINTEGVKGVDAYGNQYVSSSTNNDNLNDPGTFGGQSEHTVTTKFLLNGKGNLPDLLVKTTMHMTVNANDEATAEVTNVVVKCQ